MTDDTDGSICTECPMTEACQEKNKVDDVTYVYDDVTHVYTECPMAASSEPTDCVSLLLCM